MSTCRRAGPRYWGTDTLHGYSSFCSHRDRGCTGHEPARSSGPLLSLWCKHTHTHTYTKTDASTFLCLSVHILYCYKNEPWQRSESSRSESGLIQLWVAAHIIWQSATITYALTCEVSVSAFVPRYDFAWEDQRHIETDLRSVHPLLYSSSKPPH